MSGKGGVEKSSVASLLAGELIGEERKPGSWITQVMSPERGAEIISINLLL